MHVYINLKGIEQQWSLIYIASKVDGLPWVYVHVLLLTVVFCLLVFLYGLASDVSLYLLLLSIL